MFLATYENLTGGALWTQIPGTKCQYTQTEGQALSHPNITIPKDGSYQAWVDIYNHSDSDIAPQGETFTITLRFNPGAGNKDVVKLDIGENKYITKSDNPEIIKSFMKEKGYDFTEQMGSGYFFKSPTGQSAVATHRYYSRYYSLWTITENNNDVNNSLWTTTTNDQGITFQYPKEILAKYIIAKMGAKIKIFNGQF